jgi:hypothetical protein
MTPDQIFFVSHPSEDIPLYWEWGMLVLYVVILALSGVVLRGISQMKAGRILLAFNIFYVLVFLAVLEYQAGKVEDRINRDLFPGAFLKMDMALFWKMPCNYFYDHGRWSSSTNSRGLRSRVEIPYRKEKGEYRILALGDSWTFGVGVDDERTFSSILERELRGRRRTRKITVINAGVPGYCSAQGLLYFQRELLRYSPDLVIVKHSRSVKA